METEQMSALITQAPPPPDVKLKYVLYARKSTEDDEKQALSVPSQVKEMLAIAERENLDIVDVRREEHSAKASGERPVFKEVLEDVRRGRFNGILVWHPDRLSRNAGDLGSVVDLMDQKLLVQIRTYGQTFTNNPSEKFLLMILCSQAKLENDNKSINVKRGLKTRVEMGLWPAPAPTGYLKDKDKRLERKCETFIDPDRAPVIKKMFEKVAYEKWSGRKIYNWLKFELNFKTAGNKNLTLGNIYVILQNHFYYGTFEYPKNSGNWYQGRHEPLITKDLFDQVQQQLKGNELKTRREKEFAFTRLMTCGLCGSGITADEKYKKLKNGKINTHTYYGCTKVRDRNCQCGYINETNLLCQFEKLIDQIDIDEIGIKSKIKSEVERFKKFQRMLLGKGEEVEVSQIDIRHFAKFILREGENFEKRELLGCLKGKIVLKHKEISLNN